MNPAPKQTFVPGSRVVALPSPPASVRVTNASPPAVHDVDAVRRRELLDKLVDDRSDLKRLARSVRTVAQTVDTAQRTLAITRQSLRWLLLAGSAVSLGLWLSNTRRSKTTLLAGISMQVLSRWLEPSTRNAPPAPVRGSLTSTVTRTSAT